MIHRLEAFQYRAFDRLDITLGSYHVLAGPNGSGKSTLLDIPALFSDILNRGLVPAFLEKSPLLGMARAQAFDELIYCRRSEYFGFALEARLPDDITQDLVGQMSAKMSLDERRWPRLLRYAVRFQVFNERDLQVAGEYLSIGPEYSAKGKSLGIEGVLPRGRRILRRDLGRPAEVTREMRRSSLSFSLEPGRLALDEVPADRKQFPATVWFKEFLRRGVLHYRPDLAQLRQPSPPGQPRTLTPEARNLAWVVLELQNNNRELFDSWVEHVKTALPTIDAIRAIEVADLHQAYLKVRYQGGYEITSMSLSEGTLRIMALTILPYLADQPQLVMIEEPEDGIHPQAIEIVLSSLRSLYGSQVWIASHSPIVLAQTEIDDVIVLRYDPLTGAEALAGRAHPQLANWQGTLDLGSLFAAGILS
jgi:predicted ATPase